MDRVLFRLLLNAGADMRVRDGDDLTALQIAGQRNYNEIAALLKQAARTD